MPQAPMDLVYAEFAVLDKRLAEVMDNRARIKSALRSCLAACQKIALDHGQEVENDYFNAAWEGALFAQATHGDEAKLDLIHECLQEIEYGDD